MTAHPFGEFGMTVGFDDEHAILVVRGEVDALTAPTLGALLGVLVDHEHPNVVLDLAALEFMDAAGLRVITSVSARLATSNRILTMRATPDNTRRILDITGVAASDSTKRVRPLPRSAQSSCPTTIRAPSSRCRPISPPTSPASVRSPTTP
jgi:anti-sigma B factor antagonist